MAAQVSFWQRVSSLFGPAAAQPVAFSWWRRPARGAPVGEASGRMVELAHSLQEHFAQQDRRATELAGSLNRVGGILEQLAETQRSHGDYLRTIAEHTEAAEKNATSLAATLGRMPESLLAQAEAIRTVARSLEVSQEADTQLMHSLQQFGRAVETLGSSGTAQVDILQRLNAAQQEQHQAFTALVREQARRFVAVFVVTALLALAALAVLVTTLVMRIAA